MNINSTPTTRASSEAPGSTSQQSQSISWDRVDHAVEALEALDVVEMANYVVTQARMKGPKEAYNEAGRVRYQLAKVRQHVSYLLETICSDSLEAQQDKIKALTKANAKKRVLTGQADKQE